MPASTLTQAQSSVEATNSDLGGSLGKPSSNGVMSASSGFARDDAGLRAGLQSEMLDFAKRLQDENGDLPLDEAALAMNMMNDLTYKRANVTECVPVASSDHVAEIVGKQGAKIKALRQQTGTYIKTPCRGDEPVFIITGRREDVMVAKAQILSAAEQVSLLRARRSLQQAAMSNAVVTNAALANVSVAEAITASNLLAASANLSLAPSIQSAAASSLVGVNPTALMNLNPINLAAINAAASGLNPTANLLQNALLSNLTASSNRPQQATSQPEVSSSQPSLPSANSLSDRGASPTAQTQSASSTSGVTPISLATLGGSRVLSRLALASGAAHGNPAALLTALNSGLLAGLPSYTPPGFNLATAKHIAQLRVPERIVGLVVGPRGATIKQIQQKTNTYILTPSKGDRDAVFEIIGTAEGCSTAKKEIEDYVLSRTGMTVEQLLAQQSQVRALESFCHSAGLNINQLVASGNVDLASLATRTSTNTQQSPTASPDHGAKQHDAAHPDPSNVLQNLLASIASLSNVENNQSQATPAPASNQQRSMASNANANDALRSYESSWPVSDVPQKSAAQGEAQTHASHGQTGTNQCSMFDFVYGNLSGLINGPDDLPATLADREHDAPVYGLPQSRQTRFGTSIGNANSNSFGLATEPLAKVDVNGNVDAVPTERRPGNLKSLLAGLGLDSTFGAPGALSPNAPSHGFGNGLSLGSSLNGYGHASAANASSESSPDCSPTSDMFASRADALVSSGNLLNKLNAMRI